MFFIDLRNVLKSVDVISKSGFLLDLENLVRTITGSRQLVGAYVFDSVAKFGVEDKGRKLHDKLRYLGFRIIARNSFDVESNTQKEVDVALACDMVSHSLKDNYDVAVLVSGDRDFTPAIEQVQSCGKRVEVAAFSHSRSDELWRKADHYHSLDSYPLLLCQGEEEE